MNVKPAELTPCFSNGVQPNAVMNSPIHQYVARKTAALCARGSGDVVCRAWPHGISGITTPECELSMVQVWTDFLYYPTGLASESLIPFFITPGYSDLCVRVSVAAPKRILSALRVILQKFPGDTMTTVYSESSSPQTPYLPLGWGNWRSNANAVSPSFSYSCDFRMKNVSVDASGRCLVGMQGLIVPDNISNIQNGDTVKMYLESIIIADAVAEVV